MNELKVYNRVTDMADVYARNSRRIIELISELENLTTEMNQVFDGARFGAKVEVCGCDDKDDIPRELKRAAWAALVPKMGIEQYMSIKKREEMKYALCQDRARSAIDDPIDKLPEITPEGIWQVVEGFSSSTEEMLVETLNELYNWLKPHSNDTYKTNEQNRWKLGRKVILEFGVEERWNRAGPFRVSYSRDSYIHSLDNAFHLLDGKGLPQSHRGPLHTAILETRVAGHMQETEYFRFRCYDNRNLHLEFKRLDLVQEINLRCGNHNELPGQEKGGSFRKPGELPSREIGKFDGLDPNFFETPEKLAIRICDEAGPLLGKSVLEPSAGSGRIAFEAKRCGAYVQCMELQRKFQELFALEGIEIAIGDFLKTKPEPIYDAVLMNPPFSHQRDIAHIRHAYGFVRDRGTLVSIASSGVLFRKDKNSLDFRIWLDSVGGTIEKLPSSSFKESGTEVETVLIQIRKGSEVCE
ncbi:DUF4942 domain-containing protein [Planctomicrobium sp. SH668]|uniref:DUF4942 domain-containing protein n=1 Tax=Planctomicrobium sp. SH668 TaxID=3448126 RepID=UPI003F5BBD99